jgi:hypothetical protein
MQHNIVSYVEHVWGHTSKIDALDTTWFFAIDTAHYAPALEKGGGEMKMMEQSWARAEVVDLMKRWFGGGEVEVEEGHHGIMAAWQSIAMKAVTMP